MVKICGERVSDYDQDSLRYSIGHTFHVGEDVAVTRSQKIFDKRRQREVALLTYGRILGRECEYTVQVDRSKEMIKGLSISSLFHRSTRQSYTPFEKIGRQIVYIRDPRQSSRLISAKVVAVKEKIDGWHVVVSEADQLYKTVFSGDIGQLPPSRSSFRGAASFCEPQFIKPAFCGQESELSERQLAILDAEIEQEGEIFRRKCPPRGTDRCHIYKGRAVPRDIGEFFKDREIMKIYRAGRCKEMEGSLSVVLAFETEGGTYVVQQQATRGCTAGATAMLLLDHGKKPDVTAMALRDVGSGTTETMVSDLQDAGLTPIVTPDLDRRNIRRLKRLIENNGPAIVSVNGELGGHVIVVDHIADDSVTLRDPYHGWKITVTLEAFAKRFAGEDVIQVRS